LLRDVNAHDTLMPDVPELEVFYGRLLYVFEVTLEKNKKLKVPKDSSALLGMVQWCKDAKGDASKHPVWYTDMGTLQAVNIATIQCGVGRILVEKRWGILDLNYGCASTSFVDGDNVEEDFDEEDD
jgi:hypothetical protein